MASDELDWMPVGEARPEFAGLADTYGLSAIVGEFKYYEIWPSELPNHPADIVTLTRRSDDDIEELGRFETVDEAKDVAQRHYAENGI